MIKTITKLGNSQGLIFDSALMELAGLKVGDLVNVTVHAGGAMTLTPLNPQVGADEARSVAEELIQANDALFKRLS